MRKPITSILRHSVQAIERDKERPQYLNFIRIVNGREATIKRLRKALRDLLYDKETTYAVRVQRAVRALKKE